MTTRRKKIDKNQQRLKQESGFYTRQFSREEIIDLEAMIACGLDDEIAMLRVVLRRYYQEACACQTLEKMGEALVRISLVTTRLAGLIKIQQSLGDERQGEFSQLISRALTEVNAELQVGL